MRCNWSLKVPISLSQFTWSLNLSFYLIPSSLSWAVSWTDPCNGTSFSQFTWSFNWSNSLLAYRRWSLYVIVSIYLILQLILFPHFLLAYLSWLLELILMHHCLSLPETLTDPFPKSLPSLPEPVSLGWSFSLIANLTESLILTSH